MFSSQLRFLVKKIGSNNIHTAIKLRSSEENPVSRTIKIIGNDLKRAVNKFTTNSNDDVPLDQFPTFCDVAIIGGGAIGSSIAYWLKERTRKGLKVAVIEKDPTVSYVRLCIT